MAKRILGDKGERGIMANMVKIDEFSAKDLKVKGVNNVAHIKNKKWVVYYNSQKKRILVYEKNIQYSPLARKILKKITKKAGIYFLYNDQEKLIYIGKSKNLGQRIPASAKERKARKFAYIIIKNPADIHVLEPYVILKYAPPENTEFRERSSSSLDIGIPPLSKIINLYSEEGEEDE